MFWQLYFYEYRLQDYNFVFGLCKPNTALLFDSHPNQIVKNTIRPSLVNSHKQNLNTVRKSLKGNYRLKFVLPLKLLKVTTLEKNLKLKHFSTFWRLNNSTRIWTVQNEFLDLNSNCFIRTVKQIKSCFLKSSPNLSFVFNKI